MQDQRVLQANEAPVPKPRKKKPSNQKSSKIQPQGNSARKAQELLRPVQKASKRGLANENSTFQQTEKSTSDSLPDSSSSGNEYRALRRNYLLLEEESFGLGRETTEIESDILTLENEKVALLDELVVLEGLVDPSEFKAQGLRLP